MKRQDMSPALQVELMNFLMREYNLSFAEVIDLMNKPEEEWDSWLKAQNSKLVKVLE